MKKAIWIALVLAGLGTFRLALAGQARAAVPAKDLIRVQAATLALDHVRAIDGTGAPARPDQTILIDRGKIAAIGAVGSVAVPPAATRIDLTGYSAMPGLVGMHDHLFYSVNFFDFDVENVLAYDMPISFPRLYLAAGVTTIRTTGSFEPYADLEIKKAVESGALIGPKMNMTAPYLEGAPFSRIQIHQLTGPSNARRMVDYWASEGVGSVKVYTDISRAELRAAIDAAHRHGLTITGHLCSIGFREAAEMGIDGIEHGLFSDTEFAPDKRPDVCPTSHNASAADMEIAGAQIQAMIRTLVQHHVAITSTLPVWEEFLPGPVAPQRVLDALSDRARQAYLAERTRLDRESRVPDSATYATARRYTTMLRKEMEFERAFVRAGGLLLAGPDGVLGANIAGFGDQRGLELLVETGFSPLEAIEIATLNGAKFLKQSSRIGSLAVGKQADLVIVRGDPSTNIHDVEHTEIVFKDGVGYDSQKLIQSVAGQVGVR
jgi:imidazolonepropionase-like amidohydrolase